MRRIALALIFVLASCGGDGSPSPTASTPSSSASPVIPTAGGGSPEPSPAAATLPLGVPHAYDEDVTVRALPLAALIAPGDEVTGVGRGHTSAGDAVVIVFATPGPDPFVQARGFVVWQRSEGGEPAWRAVYGLAHGKREGVLSISADVTDVTGDGSDEALIREETGGSGACATYRVIDLASASPIWTRALCDAEVQPSPDPLGLWVVERVYEPGDAHCCPSAISERVLAWRGGRFVEVSETLTPF
ncbi:MAG TPA: hypothetical protein VNC60_04670 [Actinomycetota bacterium]|nr:hypothetical protein [Actinomycetota bacterium]